MGVLKVEFVKDPSDMSASVAGYQTGYVEHGHMTLRDTEIGRCPDGPPRGRTWFKVTVVASAHMVEIIDI